MKKGTKEWSHASVAKLVNALQKMFEFDQLTMRCDFFKVKVQNNQKVVTYNTLNAGSCIAEYILEALSKAHVS